MQYLIRTLTDSTGHTFTHVTKARENETFTVVEAESREQALENLEGNLCKGAKTPQRSKTVKHKRFTEEELIAMFGKDYKKGQ